MFSSSRNWFQIRSLSERANRQLFLKSYSTSYFNPRVCWYLIWDN